MKKGNITPVIFVLILLLSASIQNIPVWYSSMSDSSVDQNIPNNENEDIDHQNSIKKLRNVPQQNWSDDFSDMSKVSLLDNIIIDSGKATVDSSWWDTDWKYRIPVTITETDGIPRDNVEVDINISDQYYNNTGLWGSWHFSEGNGTLAEDSSGNGRDAVIQSDDWTAGISGSGMEFDLGSKAYYEGDCDIGSSGEFTLECWINGSGRGFTYEKQTSDAVNREGISYQVVGDRIYCVWREHDGSDFQIWTGTMYTNGTGWTAQKRTSYDNNQLDPHLQVVEDSIYYIWTGYDGSYIQIYWGSSHIDGHGWTDKKITTSSNNKENVQFQVVNNTLYLVWDQEDNSGNIHIYLGTVSTAGNMISNQGMTEDTKTDQYPQLYIADGVIHYIWRRDVSGKGQIVTARSLTDGTGWIETLQTSGGDSKFWPRLQVSGQQVYYVWGTVKHPNDYQIHISSMNTDGTSWTNIKSTNTNIQKRFPDIQVIGNRIFVLWEQREGVTDYVVSGQVGTDGSGWSASKITSGGTNMEAPSMRYVGGKGYYMWIQNQHIWSGRIGANIIGLGDVLGLAIQGNSLLGYLNAGRETTLFSASDSEFNGNTGLWALMSSGWHHIVLTYDSRKLIIYVDGNLVGMLLSENITFTETGNLQMGDNMYGLLDEVRILNRCINETEVSWRWNWSFGPPDMSDLVWKYWNPLEMQEEDTVGEIIDDTTLQVIIPSLAGNRTATMHLYFHNPNLYPREITRRSHNRDSGLTVYVGRREKFRTDGIVISELIERPPSAEWSSINITRTIPENTTMSVTILDGGTQEPIDPFLNFSGSNIDITGLSSNKHSALYLKAELVADNTSFPEIDSWSIHWDLEDPKILDINISSVNVFRNSSVLLNISVNPGSYQIVDMDPVVEWSLDTRAWNPILTDSVEYEFASNTITAYINPPKDTSIGNYSLRTMLEINGGPATEWTDLEDPLRVNNNPPVILNDIDNIVIIEDKEYVLDLTPYGMDVEDPSNELQWSYVGYPMEILIHSNICFYMKNIILEDNVLIITPWDNCTRGSKIILELKDLDGASIQKNITIETKSEDDLPLTILKTPKNNTTVPGPNLTLNWEGRDVDTNISEIEYDLYFGTKYPLTALVKGLKTFSYTLTGLEKNTTYYWTVIPFYDNISGECLNGSFTFRTMESPEDMDPGEIPISEDLSMNAEESTLIIRQGESEDLDITLSNTYTSSHMINLFVQQGALSGHTTLSETRFLVPNKGQYEIAATIMVPADLDPDRYDIFFIGLSELDGTKVQMKVEIKVLERNITADGDDTTGRSDDPEKKGAADFLWIIILAVCFGTLLFIIIIVLARRKRRRYDYDEDEYEDHGKKTDSDEEKVPTIGIDSIPPPAPSFGSSIRDENKAWKRSAEVTLSLTMELMGNAEKTGFRNSDTKNLLVHAKYLFSMGDYQQTMDICEEVRGVIAVFNIEQANKEQVREEIEARRKRTNYYEVLDIPSNATQKEIKKAFRIKIQEFHPDKYSGTNEEIREMLNEKMKSINEAYSVLKDSGTREDYNLEMGIFTPPRKEDEPVMEGKKILPPPPQGEPGFSDIDNCLAPYNPTDKDDQEIF